MNPLVTLAVAAGLLAGNCFAAPEDEIAALLEPIRERHSLPAMTAAVFTADSAFFQGTTGVRKVGDATKARQDDLWHLGSETKAMTATLAATFVAEGKLAWDDPVAKHFPDIAKDIDPALRPVTVADLLSHRAGLAPNLEWHEFTGRNLVRERRRAARELLTAPPASTPGEYRYSNAGFVVAGSILESIGGKPWEDLMRDRVFRPLGIRRAGFGGTGTPGRIDQPWPHLESGKPAPSNGPKTDNEPVMGPAGTVHMSARDWSRFLVDQLRGAAGQPALLKPELYSNIQSPHPAGADYALGWVVTSRPWAGGTALTHTGSNTMNFAVCWLSLPKRFGILVCVNQDGDSVGTACDEAVAALLAWHSAR